MHVGQGLHALYHLTLQLLFFDIFLGFSWHGLLLSRLGCLCSFRINISDVVHFLSVFCKLICALPYADLTLLFKNIESLDVAIGVLNGLPEEYVDSMLTPAALRS